MVVEDTGAILTFLDAQPDARPGAVGGFGYCMGGRHVLQAAAACPDRLRASASLHGTMLITEKPDSAHLGVGKLQARSTAAWPRPTHTRHCPWSMKSTGSIAATTYPQVGRVTPWTGQRTRSLSATRPRARAIQHATITRCAHATGRSRNSTAPSSPPSPRLMRSILLTRSRPSGSVILCLCPAMGGISSYCLALITWTHMSEGDTPTFRRSHCSAP